jgi:hypothetical protein
MVEFSKLVNKGKLFLWAPNILKEQPIVGVVRGVEGPGIWLESATLTDIMHSALNLKVLEATPVFFIPFKAIAWGAIFLDEPSISESLLEEGPTRP